MFERSRGGDLRILGIKRIRIFVVGRGWWWLGDEKREWAAPKQSRLAVPICDRGSVEGQMSARQSSGYIYDWGT